MKIDRDIEKIQTVLDGIVAPEVMSRDEYKEFLGALIEHLQSQLDCAHEEDGTEP